ncbi:hypothetical protein LTR08_006084 [Meristemomyces frigidus]|nr:hypothetical protein LTR08_006084 [Meristemomyces frigidus]
MAPTPSLLARTPGMASSAVPLATPVYSSAVVLAIFSFLTVLLIIPPMCWHFRNRNLGATLLVAWTIIMNLQSFVNALLWPADDVNTWYNGSGLCDVEVKLQVAWGVAGPAALGCVLRALANAMNTDRATLIKSKAQRRRDYALDLSWCIGFPLLQMLLHYIVQDRRYYVFGISGCVPSLSSSWLSILLVYIPPVIWTLVDGYFAILIITRLYRYRLTFASILASSNTTKSRFLRLYVLCLVWLFAFIPTQAYVLYINLAMHRTAYSWSETHDPTTWNQIIMVPSDGAVLFDRWIWLGSGIVVFIFFGLGKEAVTMYRSGLLAIGLGKVIPSLRPDYNSRNSETGTFSSFGSKAKLFLKRKSSISSWASDSVASRSASIAVPVSPKGMTFLETIREDQHVGEKSKILGPGASHQFTASTNQAPSPANRQPVLSRIMSVFKSNKAETRHGTNDLTLADMSGQLLTVHSEISTSSSSPLTFGNSFEVMVKKEVRQGSETAETLPMKASGGS